MDVTTPFMSVPLQVPPKRLMLWWVNAVVPELGINNFSNDWNDGIALRSVPCDTHLSARATTSQLQLGSIVCGVQICVGICFMREEKYSWSQYNAARKLYR